MTAPSEPDFQAIVDGMREKFLVYARDNITELYAALDAIAACSESREKHLAAVQRHAHSIKGAAGTFGFMSMTRIAMALEEISRSTEPDDEFPLWSCRRMVQVMDKILSAREEPATETVDALLNELAA